MMKRIIWVILISLISLGLLVTSCSTQTMVTEVPANQTNSLGNGISENIAHILSQPGINTITVMQADNGTTIHMLVGQQMLLALGNDYNWTVTVNNTQVMSRVVNIIVVRGAQGIYNANQAGTTELIASGASLCLQEISCPTAHKTFQITIEVSPHLSGKYR